MRVNPKKPLSFRNPTVYFDPSKDKARLTVSSPACWSSKVTKREGYEARLYWHYKYCESINGQVFYYTLTYNDAAVPQYFGMNCFDYEDLRDLLTGGFRKMLLRKYGTTFKYFIGAELGDGKGERGLHNNPHYHVLFFLEPDKASKFPYEKISPDEFRHLVKLYWQGFDETREGFRDYRTAKYGIAKEGNNCGLVNSFAACVYCAKYVTKDAALRQHESKVRSALELKFKDSVLTEDFYKDFYRSVIYPKFNVPLTADCLNWSLSDFELYREHFDSLDWSILLYGSGDVLINFFELACKDFIEKYSLEREYREFYELRLSELVEAGVTEYRNRYCNKCRVSHGVGDYALKNLAGSTLEPLVKVPDGVDGFKCRPLPLYYYRKLFTSVIRPISPHCPVNGKPVPLSPIRILNEDGVKYRLRRLRKNIERVSEDAALHLQLVLNDSELYKRMQCSDVNVNCFLYHDSICELAKSALSNEKQNLFLDYAVYKLVYEGRYFSLEACKDSLVGSICPDFMRDYERFIQPSIYSVDRSDIRLDSFLQGNNSDLLPYSEFPYFRRWLGLFSLFDLCSDYFNIQKDDKLENEAKERARIKRFFDQRTLKDFYSQFK